MFCIFIFFCGQFCIWHVVISRVDNTACGHCLGAADSCHDPPPGVRLLTRTQSAIMRLLLHISMFLGATTNVEVKLACYFRLLFSMDFLMFCGKEPN